jgi:hypothetical protein
VRAEATATLQTQQNAKEAINSVPG